MNTQNPPTFGQIISNTLKANKGFFIGLLLGIFIAGIVLLVLGYQLLMPEITTNGQKQRVPFYKIGFNNDQILYQGLCEIKPDASVCPKK